MPDVSGVSALAMITIIDYVPGHTHLIVIGGIS